jgi:hypothetical protein
MLNRVGKKKKKRQKLALFFRKIWSYQKKVVPLHAFLVKNANLTDKNNRLPRWAVVRNGRK